MPLLKDVAIILRRLDFSESSQVLAAFGREHGKLRLIAKGIKRSTKTRFAPAIDLLEVGHCVLSIRAPRQEAMAILTEWRQSASFAGLRDRLDRLYGAQYAAGLVTDLTEDWDPHPALFDALIEVLADLAHGPAALPGVIRFQRHLLDQVGALPIFDACVGCGRPFPFDGELNFSSFEGGLLCRDCEPARAEKMGLPRQALPWLQSPSAANRSVAGMAMDPLALCAAFNILHYHITHLRGKPDTLARMFLTACEALRR
jgi:DNA repair protein RecO (recombination protein O)